MENPHGHRSKLSHVQGPSHYTQGHTGSPRCNPGDKVIFQANGDIVNLRKVPKDKLSDTLRWANPLAEPSLEFQRRLRRELDTE